MIHHEHLDELRRERSRLQAQLVRVHQSPPFDESVAERMRRLQRGDAITEQLIEVAATLHRIEVNFMLKESA